MIAPLSLLRTISFFYNLNPNHVSYHQVRKDLAKYKSGFRGERSIHYYLYPIIHKTYRSFHNARLYAHDQHFEIDHKLISSQFIWFIEVKNHTGTIRFDHESGAMFQTVNNETKVYQDPILQVERQKKLLNIWLKERGIHAPIESIVCFTNQYAILERDEKTDPRIIYGYKLPHVYEQLIEQYQNHPHHIQTEDLLTRLKTESEPLDLSLLKKYGLKLDDFEPGLMCSSCYKKSMTRDRHRYKCKLCGQIDSEAVHNGLKDYYLIFGPKITNEQARYWFNEESSLYMKKILTRYASDKVGSGRGLTYLLDFDLATDFDYLMERLKRV